MLVLEDISVLCRFPTGLSVMHRVDWSDEWLAEAYMETDYSVLTNDDFQKVLNDYLSYLVKEGEVYES